MSTPPYSHPEVDFSMQFITYVEQHSVDVDKETAPAGTIKARSYSVRGLIELIPVDEIQFEVFDGATRHESSVTPEEAERVGHAVSLFYKGVELYCVTHFRGAFREDIGSERMDDVDELPAKRLLLKIREKEAVGSLKSLGT